MSVANCISSNLLKSDVVDLSSQALDAVKQRFFDQGMTVVEWARANEFDVHLVYGVLSGRTKARRGESHRIAVALGLKHPPELSRAKALEDASEKKIP